MEAKGTDQHQTYRELAMVLMALLCLTAITVYVSRIEAGFLKIPVALTIASAKTSLVLIYFMHMKMAGKAVLITFLVTIVTLAVFIGFIFFDIAYR